MVVYGYSRLVGYDEQLQLVPDILERVDDRGRPHLHAAPAARPQMVGRPAVHRRGLPLLLGGRRQQQGAVAVRPAAGAARRRRARRRSRSSTTRRCATAGTSPIRMFLPALAGAEPALHLPAGALPEAVPREVRRPRQGQRAGQGGRRRAAGRRCTRRRTSSTATTIRTCRRSSRGCNTTPRRPTRFVLERNPYFHRVDPAGRQLPYIDRGRSSASPTTSSSRPRPAPATSICRRATCASTTTPSSSRARSATTTSVLLWENGARLADRALSRTSTSRIPSGGS